MIDLSGKRALVCGASQGIGEATARLFAQLGASVTLLARSGEKLKDISQSLEGEGHGYLACDISDRETLKETMKSQLDQPFHILVCNTGGPKGGPLAGAEPEEFMQAFENHVLVNSMLTRMLLPGMKDAGYGRIINIISTSVKVPIPNLGVSNTIRGAVANWAKTLSVELAPNQITVNNVLPGFTETPRLKSLIENAAKKEGQAYEQMVEVWKKRVPMGRFAQAEEVANAIAFLASPAAGYISGVNVPVDGGRLGCL